MAGLQCSHGQECVREISSIIENGNLSLNNDSHETDETIHEVFVTKPISDIDFLQGGQLTKNVFFHEKDNADLLNNLEEYSFLASERTLVLKSSILHFFYIF